LLDIGLIDKRMGYPSLSILRSDFQRILLARLQSLGVSVQYGRKAVRIGAGAEVHFDNGATLTADLIVGADGRMASCARRYVTGDDTPIYQGFINWIGVCERDDIAFDVDAISDYWGTGERFGIVPVARNKAYWAGGAAQATIGARHPDAYRAEFQRIFADWPEPVRLIIAGTPSARINKIYVHDHDPVPTWHRHKLVLVGDAAHASLPTSGRARRCMAADRIRLSQSIDHHRTTRGASARFAAGRRSAVDAGRRVRRRRAGRCRDAAGQDDHASALDALVVDRRCSSRFPGTRYRIRALVAYCL
jgi:2-polyprenyl-6-methoxyphenol hydroxylase-like FAD-dependent oxidoreductase